MSLLLDTHVLIWASEDPTKLGKTTRALLVDDKQQLHVSAISLLEIARLVSLEQIKLTSSVGSWTERALHALGATITVIDEKIAIEAYALPGAFHADPADRLLVASARHLGLRLVTADSRILAYRPVRTHNAKK